MKKKYFRNSTPPKAVSAVFRYSLFALVLFVLITSMGLAQTSVFILAMFVHEGFHLLSALVLGIKVTSFSPSSFGFQIKAETAGVIGLRAVLLYLSGPAGNILFALGTFLASLSIYIPQMPFFVLYNLIIAFVNFLPAYPLDAARALEGILSVWKSRVTAVKTVSYISYLTALLLFALGLYLFVFSTDNILLMVVAIFIFSTTRKELAYMEMDMLLRTIAGMTA